MILAGHSPPQAFPPHPSPLHPSPSLPPAPFPAAPGEQTWMTKPLLSAFCFCTQLSPSHFAFSVCVTPSNSQSVRVSVLSLPLPLPLPLPHPLPLFVSFPILLLHCCIRLPIPRSPYQLALPGFFTFSHLHKLKPLFAGVHQEGIAPADIHPRIGQRAKIESWHAIRSWIVHEDTISDSPPPWPLCHILCLKSLLHSTAPT